MNNSWLNVDPVFPVWTVVAVTLPLFLFFIWREVKRPDRFLFVRIIAQVFILFSLLGLILRPSYLAEEVSDAVMILTPGFDRQKADSVVKANPAIRVLRTNDADHYGSADELASYRDIPPLANGIRIIIGEGLPTYALELIDQKNFQFIPRPTPAGIVQITIPKPITVNKKSLMQGVLNSSETTQLKLIGPAGVEDSAVVASGITPFTFSFRPVQTGRYIYTLSAQGTSLLNSESVPIEVLPERKLRILFLQKFPTAEMRYLKNFLAEKGHALALRYQTSKTEFRYEYANVNPLRLAPLTTQAAESFDLIFMDNNVLGELNETESAVLETSIHSGLGMVLLFNDIPENSKKLNRFLPIGLKRIVRDTVHVQIPGSKKYTFPVLPLEITPDPAIQAITVSRERILSGYTYTGFGKVAFQLLRETYRVALEGNEDDYSFIWSSLIERASRSENEMFKIKLINPFPCYENEPLALEVISSGAQPSLYADDHFLPLAEDVILDDRWLGKGWAGEAGWHQISIGEDSTRLNYFVSNKNDWGALRIANQMRQNALAQSTDPEALTKVKKYQDKAISPLLYFGIFLLAAGFLWIAPKL